MHPIYCGRLHIIIYTVVISKKMNWPLITLMESLTFVVKHHATRYLHDIYHLLFNSFKESLQLNLNDAVGHCNCKQYIVPYIFCIDQLSDNFLDTVRKSRFWRLRSCINKLMSQWYCDPDNGSLCHLRAQRIGHN